MVLTQRRFTADEWLDSPWNTTLSELVDGIPVERMTTSGGHAEVAKALTRWLERAEVAGFGRWYAGPAGVILGPDGARNNIREPDLCFVCSLFPGIPLPVADLFRHFQSNHGASR